MTQPQNPRQKLEGALEEYMAACGDGAYLTDWVIFAAGANPGDPNVGTHYGFWMSQHSSPHAIRGLVDLGSEEICSDAICMHQDDDEN
jgi:hypothetical protein